MERRWRAGAAAAALLLAYGAVGGAMFYVLEGAGGGAAAAGGAHRELRARTVDRLWAITEDLNILYKDNWTRLAADELAAFQRALLRAGGSGGGEDRWTLATSVLYAVTLITTIGRYTVSAHRSHRGHE